VRITCKALKLVRGLSTAKQVRIAKLIAKIFFCVRRILIDLNNSKNLTGLEKITLFLRLFIFFLEDNVSLSPMMNRQKKMIPTCTIGRESAKNLIDMINLLRIQIRQIFYSDWGVFYEWFLNSLMN